MYIHREIRIHTHIYIYTMMCKLTKVLYTLSERRRGRRLRPEAWVETEEIAYSLDHLPELVIHCILNSHCVEVPK